MSELGVEVLQCERCLLVYGASTQHKCPGQEPLGIQIGGQHYKGLAIQPVEYCHKNKLGFCESSAIKYLTRWREKGGIEDLKKAAHFIEMLIEMESVK